MADCEYADDAYLVAHFPALVVRAPEQWLVTVLAAQTGDYMVTAKDLPSTYPATAPPDTPAMIRGDGATGLLGALQFNPWVVASAVGASSVQVLENVLGPFPVGLGLTVSGPAAGTISAQLTGGGDVSAEFRELWLEAAKCGLPPCCVVTCASDYTLMHAALAAHLAFLMFNLGASGTSAGDFERMTLGPATLWKGKAQGAASSGVRPNQTTPGDLFLSLQAKYVFGAMCA